MNKEERELRRKEQQAIRDQEREEYAQQKREKLKQTPHICDPIVRETLVALEQYEIRLAFQHTREIISCLRVNGFSVPERQTSKSNSNS